MPEAQCPIPPVDKSLTRRQLLSFEGQWHGRSACGTEAGEWIRISHSAMACRFEVVISSGKRPGILAAQECFDEVDRLESILSVFRASSELTRLHDRASTESVPVGPELFGLLQLSQLLHRETEGAFDVSAGALTQCWEFDTRQPRLPSDQALHAARDLVGLHRVLLGQDRSVSFEIPGIRINFGGVGKGYALDRAASKIRARGVDNALLSAGYSSILAIGEGPNAAGWQVGLRHPLLKDQRSATLRLRSCALGTSGQEEQEFEVDGQRYGHILDPRTGFPPKGVLSVTVIADSAARADALATAFFVGGQELAERYCDQHLGVVTVMLLESDSSHPIVIGSSSQVEVESVNG